VLHFIRSAESGKELARALPEQIIDVGNEQNTSQKDCDHWGSR
jgi:hypothetical protein